jgi:hypothetical protein
MSKQSVHGSGASGTINQEPDILNSYYENYIKKVVENIETSGPLKDKNNIKYLTIVMGIFITYLILGMLWYGMLYTMFFFSSLKCMLWLFENYNPPMIGGDEALPRFIELLASFKKVLPCRSGKLIACPQDKVLPCRSGKLIACPQGKVLPCSDKPIQSKGNHTDRCVTETSSSDVLEYYIVPIFIVLIMHPMSYIPIPFLPYIVHGVSIMLGITAMINKVYRQKICIFIRDLFVDKNSKKKGVMHRFLKMLCCTLESMSLVAFNMTHNFCSIYSRLGNVTNIVESMKILTMEAHMNRVQHTDQNEHVSQSVTCSGPGAKEPDDDLDEDL